jgi:hypothetical protein
MQTLVQSLVPAKFSAGIFQDSSTLPDLNWVVSMVKSDLMDAWKQLRIAAVGQSPTGLWYTCVHAKQLQRDPMFMSGKNNKIQKMQGISTSKESKD